jgi:hypothetical protein
MSTAPDFNATDIDELPPIPVDNLLRRSVNPSAVPAHQPAITNDTPPLFKNEDVAITLTDGKVILAGIGHLTTFPFKPDYGQRVCRLWIIKHPGNASASPMDPQSERFQLVTDANGYDRTPHTTLVDLVTEQDAIALLKRIEKAALTVAVGERPFFTDDPMTVDEVAVASPFVTPPPESVAATTAHRLRKTAGVAACAVLVLGALTVIAGVVPVAYGAGQHIAARILLAHP